MYTTIIISSVICASIGVYGHLKNWDRKWDVIVSALLGGLIGAFIGFVIYFLCNLFTD